LGKKASVVQRVRVMVEEMAGGGEGVGDVEGVAFSGVGVTVGVSTGEGEAGLARTSHPASPTAANNKIGQRAIISPEIAALT